MIYLSFRTWGIREKIISDQKLHDDTASTCEKNKIKPQLNTEKNQKLFDY